MIQTGIRNSRKILRGSTVADYALLLQLRLQVSVDHFCCMQFDQHGNIVAILLHVE